MIIIGGGLSGLALAQCFRNQGIECEIYERDTDEHSRAQGWAITLREYDPAFHFPTVFWC